MNQDNIEHAVRILARLSRQYQIIVDEMRRLRQVNCYVSLGQIVSDKEEIIRAIRELKNVFAPRVHIITLPEWDEKEMRPKTKMPNCPRCGEDELGMLSENIAFCYKCGFEFDQSLHAAKEENY